MTNTTAQRCPVRGHPGMAAVCACLEGTVALSQWHARAPLPTLHLATPLSSQVAFCTAQCWEWNPGFHTCLIHIPALSCTPPSSEAQFIEHSASTQEAPGSLLSPYKPGVVVHAFWGYSLPSSPSQARPGHRRLWLKQTDSLCPSMSVQKPWVCSVGRAMGMFLAWRAVMRWGRTPQGPPELRA